MAKQQTRKASGNSTKRPKSGGRKAGSKNLQYDEADATKSQCKRCGSTERGPYRARIRRPLPINSEHRPQFTHRVQRSCRCAKCGQWRWDFTLENESGWGE